MMVIFRIFHTETGILTKFCISVIFLSISQSETVSDIATVFLTLIAWALGKSVNILCSSYKVWFGMTFAFKKRKMSKNFQLTWDVNDDPTMSISSWNKHGFNLFCIDCVISSKPRQVERRRQQHREVCPVPLSKLLISWNTHWFVLLLYSTSSLKLTVRAMIPCTAGGVAGIQ